MTATIDLNQEKLQAFLDRTFTDLAACYGGVMVSLGDKLGLYRALAGAGPSSAEAGRQRGLRRALRARVARQPGRGRVHRLRPQDRDLRAAEHAAVWRIRRSPTLLTPAFNIRRRCGAEEDQAADARSAPARASLGRHDERLFCGVAAFYRNAYRAALVPQWLPALDGVVERLEQGAKVADIGCGHGHSIGAHGGGVPELDVLRARSARGLDRGGA